MRVTGKPLIVTVEEPELRRGLQLFYDAFWELDSERSHGSGYTRIPWHSIIAYSMYYDLSDEQTEDLVTHITAMDLAYINYLKSEDDARDAARQAKK